MEKTKIEYKGDQYEIPTVVIEKLQYIGVQIDAAYLDYVLSFKHPLYTINQQIALLLDSDYYNHILYSADEGLGRIVRYCDGEIEYFEDLVAALKTHKKDCRYGFEKCHQIGQLPFPQKTSFFGVSFSLPYERVSLAFLNRRVKELTEWKHPELTKEWIKSDCAKLNIREPSFEEYTAAAEKHGAFCFARELRSISRRIKQNLSQRNPVDYKNQLLSLFDKYSVDGKIAFEKVENLQDYDLCPGIYILCLEKRFSYYVGQTEKSLKARILQHFTKPHSTFDKTHVPDDITSIFVLPVNPYDISCVEMDCISNFNPIYLENSLAGGGSIQQIHDSDYCKSSYSLKDSIRKKIIASVPNAKKIAEDERYWRQYEREGNTAVARIKQTKPENLSFELCEKAVRYDSQVFQYIPQRFLSREFCYTIYEYSGDLEIVKYFPQELFDEEFALQLVKYNRRVTKYLPASVKTDKVMEAAGYRKRK